MNKREFIRKTENGESKIHNCNQCKYIRVYDYGKKIYYCDNEEKTDDMGKIGVDNLPEMSPKWCPLRK